MAGIFSSRSILLGFILTPFVAKLRHWSVPRIAAVLIPVAIAFILIASLAFVVGRQLVQLASNLPNYQATITTKIRSLQDSAPGGGVVDKVTSTIQYLKKELSGEAKKEGAPPSAITSPTADPITVRLEREQPNPLQIIQSVVGPLLAPLASAGLVVILLIFVLLEREDLRDRFIRLVGAGDLQKSTQAINDAAGRVSRYLVMQLIVNFTYGIPLGIALYLVGVPNAILWGLLAAILRFVPYLGPFLAALFPVALAIAVDPGWTMLFWVVGVFLAAELISNNVIEPWLYGASTGLSSLAIIIAAIFWTLLWGPVGLFLSTPLTVCLVVIGRYVPQLEFLGVLLGSDPVLAPEEQLYQRLVAGNMEEAVELAEDYVDEHSSREFYDHVAIPALRLAENDRQRSSTDINYRRQVADTAVCIVDEVADHVREQAADATAPAQPDKPPRVLCLAGRTELDHATAHMIAQVLEERSINARVMPPIAVSQGALGQLDLDGIDVVCLMYLHPQPQVFARYIFRRLRRRAPHLKLVACCWNLTPDLPHTDDLKKQMASDAIFTSLQPCLDQVEEWIRQSVAGEPARVETSSELKQLEALQRLGLEGAVSRRFEAATKEIAQAFKVPIALVSLVADNSLTASPAESEGKDNPADARASHQESLDAYVVSSEEVLVCSDVTKDTRFADDARVLEKGIRFYAGAPLRTSSGQIVGCLSIVDTEPRDLADDKRRHLQETADELMRHLEAEADSRNEMAGGTRSGIDRSSA